MEYLLQCPICKNQKFADHIKTRDHFLSGEEFNIVKCESCGFRFLNPRPDEIQIKEYYKSEQYLAHSNKKKGLFSGLYQWARKRNLKYKYKIISRLSTKGRILDIGSATGEFLEYMKSKKWETFGMEPAGDVRERAGHRTGITMTDEKGLKKEKDGSFNVITLWHVLEHIHRLDEQIDEIDRLLAKSGWLIIALPNPDAFDARHYDQFWAGYDLPRHLYHFSKNDLTNLLSKKTFVLKEVHPLKFDAYYVSLLSEKYKSGKTSYIKAFSLARSSNKRAKAENDNFSSRIYVFLKT